jgi:hypothetical protein
VQGELSLTVEEEGQVTDAGKQGWGGDEKVRSSKPEHFDPIASTKVAAPLVHLDRKQDHSVHSLVSKTSFIFCPSVFARVIDRKTNTSSQEHFFENNFEFTLRSSFV